MVAQHRALARQTRRLKTLIHPSCKGIESFWILKFLSDQTRLSVYRSHDTRPNMNIRSREILRFQMLNESCASFKLLLTKSFKTK
jgi:hypothetical protein